jgi:hypothetical protein
MPKFEPKEYLAVERYVKAQEAFHGIAGVVLFEFARHEACTRNVVIRNFVARVDTMTRAIVRLWDLQDYQDCWILHRCLLDRLFHLWELEQTDEFDTFEAWSFLEQYKAINRVRSDQEFNGSVASKLFELTTEQKQRAQQLAKAPPVWHRPKAEDVAKSLDMRFLYSYGYDYASTHVHPMADDGHRDFFTLTKLEPGPDFPDERAVLSNTLLIATLVVQHGLNASTLRWRAVVYDFYEQLREFLGTGVEDYGLTFRKITQAFGDGLPMAEGSPPATS